MRDTAFKKMKLIPTDKIKYYFENSFHKDNIPFLFTKKDIIILFNLKWSLCSSISCSLNYLYMANVLSFASAF